MATDNTGLPGAHSLVTISRLITYCPCLIIDDRPPEYFATHEWLVAFPGRRHPAYVAIHITSLLQSAVLCQFDRPFILSLLGGPYIIQQSSPEDLSTIAFLDHHSCDCILSRH